MQMLRVIRRVYRMRRNLVTCPRRYTGLLSEEQVKRHGMWRDRASRGGIGLVEQVLVDFLSLRGCPRRSTPKMCSSSCLAKLVNDPIDKLKPRLHIHSWEGSALYSGLF
jgi:hypothetical protein